VARLQQIEAVLRERLGSQSADPRSPSA